MVEKENKENFDLEVELNEIVKKGVLRFMRRWVNEFKPYLDTDKDVNEAASVMVKILRDAIMYAEEHAIDLIMSFLDETFEDSKKSAEDVFGDLPPLPILTNGKFKA